MGFGMGPGILDKREVRFLPYSSCAGVRLLGNWLRKDGHAIGLDPSARIRIRLGGVTPVYGLFNRHDWSGKICVSVNGEDTDCFDLYSPFPFQQAIPLYTGRRRRSNGIEIRNLGRNSSSRSCQTVFLGLLLNADAAARYGHEPDARREQQDAPSHAEAFDELQARMADRYAASVARMGCPEEHSRERWGRYELRYREALVYAVPGCRFLDVGAGFLTEDFVRSVILPANLDYWVQDIDARVIARDQAVFTCCGMPFANATQGRNSSLPYPSGFFDLVFSSHCLEHSDDLPRTFSEIRRVLRPSGILFFAVPFGFDDSLEHTYAVDVDGWRGLTAARGFEIINEHIGSIYTGHCRDLVIVARKAP